MTSESRIQDSKFAENGFQIFPAVISKQQCDLLAMELSAQFEFQQSSTKSTIGGVRNLLRQEIVKTIATSQKLASILEELIGEKLFPVRAIFFDKTTKSNWKVPWHQDLTIAVAQQVETSNFTGWSIKDEVPHVHPPKEILENMVTVRLHLDNCNADNGALKVIPGSHLRGKLDAPQIAESVQKNIVVCEVPKRGALVMRPLLLHSSSPAQNPSHRRVLHLEFALDELPNGLKWFERQ